MSGLPAADTERIRFPNRDHVELSAELEGPGEGEAKAYALFAHCFTCSKGYKAPLYVSRHLAARGVATLRFDFPGLGRSGGEFARTTLSGNAGDVADAAAWLGDYRAPPRLLVGHSLGAAAVLLAAVQVPSARMVATIAAPSRPERMGEALSRAREEAAREGTGTLEVGGRTFRLRNDFFRDIEGLSLREAAEDLDADLLILHSPDDRIVPFSAAEELHEWAPGSSELVRLEGADHLLDREEHARRAAEAICEYLDLE
ncbi:MAG: alpha/beta hydrolase [bacterium]